MCSMGTWRIWKARTADRDTFVETRQIGMAGCGVAVIMLFAGFIGIAENFFELWRSADIGGSVVGSAYRYGGVIALIGILVGTTGD